MKNFIVIILSLIAVVTIAQDIRQLKDVKPEEDFENIWVKKISDDDHQTSFVIWVKQSVRLHKHAEHSENIYVLGGKGEMTINDEKFVIKKGDYFNIPKNTPHALKVLSSSPVKVLSIQSPKFTGEDRIFLDE
ncbi:MAG: cupin domain-containing protein [Crocinitomicaceae bacterium]|nr:cupin domain-containing protein [Crocinitomicaceae bacterium]